MARLDRAILAFELSTIVALQFLVIVVIFASTVVLYVVSYQSLRSQVAHISTVGDLLFIVQRSIAGILIVVLGLEVLETLKAYFRDHHVRLEVIIVVATIAASGHLVQVDFEHASPLSLFGLSAVILSLTLGYFLVKKAYTHVAIRKTSPGQLPVENPSGVRQFSRDFGNPRKRRGQNSY